ncbi:MULTISPECIES: zinc-finger domain-containing protein [unclassified Staphylococcus]|uniref:zinc-finger domain-containing protein n=1 Tax=unclassified Staphylococcus TaxID=91994 RepID=UPI0021CF4019|nr:MULTISPECIES: zinc-finger domain-containing protein [unclassified Staphylococcus]UXR70609.1 zinc-finger domain-containing protein [Staphylococcus sp. IVB6246]UXR72657.1 zinc-finger domain-containing protein [Staphylococcus sp. IVB6240]UXR74968.1 zinc-finger domain-containing protein [Staphylococcus sp. IVB6238]UXR75346.1 zinc-finger domain-containing protein [Staphylococcus sp. IVB6233]UXR81444.1 zinc-finger domain-containing protein [Staphylococcus sp. IVB6218]
MIDMLTDEKRQAIETIDTLMADYCTQCLIKSHLRKEESKTSAHHFCINECSVGQRIQALGKYLQ